jgi:hypothetical protein
MFIKALDTLKFPEPWDMHDFQYVLDHLRADGYECIEPAPWRSSKPAGLVRH